MLHAPGGVALKKVLIEAAEAKNQNASSGIREHANQVTLQSIFTIDGTTYNYQKFAQVRNLKIQLSNINDIKIQNLIFSGLSNVQQDIINIVNCRNITILNCNFINIQSSGYQLINITEAYTQNNQFTLQDYIMISNNEFQSIKFSSQGSILYINNNTQPSINIENNTFSQNYQQQQSMIYLLDVQSNILAIANNIFNSNTLSQNNGTVFNIQTPNTEIYFSNNYYSFNQASNGNGGCLFINSPTQYISFYNESHISNTAQFSNGSVQGGNGGSIYIYNSQSEIDFDFCTYFNNTASTNAGGIYLDTTQNIVRFNNSQFNQNAALNGGSFYITYSADKISFNTCNFQKNLAYQYGGTSYIQYTSGIMEFIQCNFISNKASQSGGAYYIILTSSQFLYSSCNFFNNSVTLSGGALYLENNYGYFQFLSVNFSQNSAQNGGSIYLYLSYSQIDFDSCSHSSNLASEQGGSIYTEYQFVNVITFNKNYFQNNYASQGGAISISYIYDNVNFTSNIYSNNQAAIAGGALLIFGNSESILFYNESCYQNVAGVLGGGFYFTEGSDQIQIYNSSFEQNQALNGGAIYFVQFGSVAILVNNTFDNNIASSCGGAVYFQNLEDITYLQNNNFFSNTASINGGSIYLQFLLQEIILLDSGFYDNQGKFSGGAIAIYQAHGIQIKNSFFEYNSAIFGGAIDLEQVYNSIVIQYCNFLGNSANYYGGALSLIGDPQFLTSLQISQSKFYSNTAKSQGGGDIYILIFQSVNLFQNDHYNSQSALGGSVYIYNVTILQQLYTNFLNSLSYQQGGAMYIYQIDSLIMANASFINCTSLQGTVYIIEMNNVYLNNIQLSNNIVQDQAGGFYVESATNTTIQNITIDQNSAQNDAGGLMIQSNTYLSISNIVCTSNTGYSGNGGCLFISDTQNIIFQDNQIYENNLAGSKGGAIYINNIISGNLFLFSMSIRQNSATQGGGIAIVNTNNNVQIKLGNITFIQNTALQEGGALYFNTIFNNEPVDSSIVYQLISADQGFSAIKQQNYSQLIMNSSYFESNMAVYGGAVAILQNQLTIINNCQFQRNQALINDISNQNQASGGGGGAIYQCDVKYSWTSNSLFQLNSAQTGGGYYQTQTIYDSQITQSINQLNNSFLMNVAFQDGGGIDIEYCQQSIMIQECKFLQNSAVIAGGLIITIQKWNLLSQNQATRILQLGSYNNATQISITKNQFSGNSATNNAQYAQNLRIVIGEQISQTQSNSLNNQLLAANTFSSTDNAISLGCQPGEQQDLSTYLCSPCTVSLYSQGGYGSQCVACPPNADCLGNYSLMQVQSGYWRENQSSLIVIQCIHTPRQCLGGEFCQTGYTGLLCEGCQYDQGYARDTPFTCGQCINSASVWVVAIFGIIFTVAMVLLVVQGNISYRKAQLLKLVTKKICKHLITIKDNTPALTRTLISHAQILTILFSIDIKYPKQLTNFYSYFGQYTQVTTFNLICAFGTFNGLHPAYMNILYNHLSVFISFLLLMFILGVLHWIKVLNFKEQAKAFTLNLLVFVMPGMINQLLPLLSQRTVDQITNETFTVQELEIVWDSQQFQNSYRIVLPLIFFWLIVFASVVYVIFTQGKIFFQKRNDLDLLQERNTDSNNKLNSAHSKNSEVIYNYGNFFIGYTEEGYYWEAVLMAGKLTLIVIQNVFSYDPMVVTSFSILVVATVLVLQMMHSPFRDSIVKMISNFCLIVQIVSISVLQIMFSEPNRLELFYFSLVILIATNYCILFFLLKYFLQDTYNTLKPQLINILLYDDAFKLWIQQHTWFLNSSFYQNLLKSVKRDKIVSYGWNVIRIASKNMIQYINDSKTPLLSKDTQASSTEEAEKEGNYLTKSNLKRELLIKILFNEWKQNQKDSLNYKFYLRWKTARGEQIQNDMVDEQIAEENQSNQKIENCQNQSIGYSHVLKVSQLQTKQNQITDSEFKKSIKFKLLSDKNQPKNKNNNQLLETNKILVKQNKKVLNSFGFQSSQILEQEEEAVEEQNAESDTYLLKPDFELAAEHQIIADPISKDLSSRQIGLKVATEGERGRQKLARGGKAIKKASENQNSLSKSPQKSQINSTATQQMKFLPKKSSTDSQLPNEQNLSKQTMLKEPNIISPVVQVTIEAPSSDVSVAAHDETKLFSVAGSLQTPIKQNQTILEEHSPVSPLVQQVVLEEPQNISAEIQKQEDKQNSQISLKIVEQSKQKQIKSQRTLTQPQKSSADVKKNLKKLYEQEIVFKKPQIVNKGALQVQDEPRIKSKVLSGMVQEPQDDSYKVSSEPQDKLEMIQQLQVNSSNLVQKQSQARQSKEVLEHETSSSKMLPEPKRQSLLSLQKEPKNISKDIQNNVRKSQEAKITSKMPKQVSRSQSKL